MIGLLFGSVSTFGFFVELPLPSVSLAAYQADSSTCSGLITGWFQYVAFIAMCSSCIFSSLACTTKDILSCRHKSKMRWVYASAVAANVVIELRNIFTETFRNWFNQPSKKNSVDRCADVHHACGSVSSSIERPRPIPAAGYFIDCYLREDASNVFGLKMIDDEILLISHARVILHKMRVWLGPRQCFSTVSARILYIELVKH